MAKSICSHPSSSYISFETDEDVIQIISLDCDAALNIGAVSMEAIPSPS